jgi:hypothetical protein
MCECLEDGTSRELRLSVAVCKTVLHLSLLLVSFLRLFPRLSTVGTKKEPAGVEIVPIVTPCNKARPADSKEYNESVFEKFWKLSPLTVATAAIGFRFPHPMTPNIARIADLSNAEIEIFCILFTDNIFSKAVYLKANP